MTPRVNLLPTAYRQSKRQNRRCRRGALFIGLLLIGELAAGLYVHRQASETRAHLAAAEAAHFAAREMKAQLIQPRQKLQVLEQQVELAERLRTTHHWSRLLAMLGETLPERVVLTSLATDPPRWAKAVHKKKPDQKTRIRSTLPGQNRNEPAPLKSALNGVRVRGYAADYRDLSELTAILNGSGAFHMVDLKEARRGQYLGREVVQFEVDCRW
jgi:Tfp pilus assembly protein PilN